MAGKHADLLSPDAMRDYFGEVYWRKGEALDREKILASLSHERARAGLRLPQGRGCLPHDRERARSGDRRAREPRKQARDALAALRAGAPAGAVARRLQPFIVQVPPKARDLLLTNGHARFVDGDAGEFVELVTGSLYRDEVGLEWENADYLAVENSII